MSGPATDSVTGWPAQRRHTPSRHVTRGAGKCATQVSVTAATAASPGRRDAVSPSPSRRVLREDDVGVEDTRLVGNAGSRHTAAAGSIAKMNASSCNPSRRARASGGQGRAPAVGQQRQPSTSARGGQYIVKYAGAPDTVSASAHRSTTLLCRQSVPSSRVVVLAKGRRDRECAQR